MLNSVRTVLDRPGWAVGMDLAYDFVSDRKFGPALPPSDTHAQTIYAPNAVGLYTPYAANVLTRTDLGLQTVPTRTNLALRSTDLSVSPWQTSKGAPTSVTVTPNYATAPDGTMTATRIQFVVPSSYAIRQQNITVTAAQYTLSVYMKSTDGSTITVYSGDDTVGGGDTAKTVTGQWQRFTDVITYPSTSGKFMINAIADADVLVWQAQYELGAFASPPILTTGSAATVNGNQQVISLPTQLAVGVAGFIQVDLKNIGVSTLQILSFENIDNANALRIRNQSNNLAAQMINSSVSILTTSDGALATGIQTIAFAFSSAYQAIQIVGGALVSGNPGVYPSGLLRAGIGGNSHDAAANMYQYTRKLALKFGPQDAGTFAQMYDRAQLMASAS